MISEVEKVSGHNKKSSKDLKEVVTKEKKCCKHETNEPHDLQKLAASEKGKATKEKHQ